MGRPDTLGADLYHNRQFPIIGETENEYSSSSDLVDPPSCAIIKSMVDYSKVIRSICLGIYLPETTVPRTVTLAHQIDQDLQKWVESLPEPIRPTGTVQPRSLRSAKEAQWMKRQRLVLTMRKLFAMCLQPRQPANSRARLSQLEDSPVWVDSSHVDICRACINPGVSRGHSDVS